MKFRSMAVLSLALLLFACHNAGKDATQALEDIRQQEAALLDAVNAPVDQAKAEALVKAYRHYYQRYPEDSNTSAMLFKTAELLMNIGQPRQAIEVLDTLITRYPGWSLIPEAMHLKAFIYDDKIHDIEKARQAYQAVIDRFPDSPLAENSKGCLLVLGKSPEEIIKSFEQQRGQDATTRP